MKRSRWTLAGILVGAVAMGAGPRAVAQDHPAEATPAPEAKPKDAPAAPDPKPKEAPPKVTAGADGFVLQSANGAYKLQFRGLGQFDGRFFPADHDQTAVDTFLLRRARPMLQGSAGEYFDFNLTPDFGGGVAVIQDAYFDVKASPKLHVRIGKFKPPIGLEHLQSDATLPFIERAYPTIVLPNRDVGFQASGDLGGGVVSYAAGLFNGSPDAGTLDIDTNDSKDAVGRLVLSPFKKTKSFLKELGLGIGASTGKQSGALPAFRSGGQISIITLLTGVVADGTRKRWAPEVSLYVGSFGFGAEYVESESFMRKASAAPRIQLSVKAWQSTVSYALTGDLEAYTGIKVKKPFDPAKGQWGALQLVARANGAELGAEATSLIDPAKSVHKAFAWAVGLNWYPNRNLKALLDYERTTFTGGAKGGGDRSPENALFIRTQLSF
jgi:phosphate-selective porin OprO/OprP